MANIALRPVKIDDAARARAKEIRAYAFEHRESLTKLRDRLSTNMPMADAENYSMQIPVGYNIAYTIEQRSEGWVQHISIFQNTPRIMPHPPAVAQILEELFDIRASNSNLPGRKHSGVLGDALAVGEQKLPNGCLAVDLLYPFKFPMVEESFV